jgi:hypothetical protein
MLYFAETAWTLPNMPEMNAQFENTCDEGEFEGKLGGLVRNIQRVQARGKGEEGSWKEAVGLAPQGGSLPSCSARFRWVRSGARPCQLSTGFCSI